MSKISLPEMTPGTPDAELDAAPCPDGPAGEDCRRSQEFGPELAFQTTRKPKPTPAIPGLALRDKQRSEKPVTHTPDPTPAKQFGPSMDVPGYEDLATVLSLAYDQSANGKGKERHANGKHFADQPIMEIGRMVGAGYPLGQAMKKAQEARGMLGRDQNGAAQAELLGAIVYLSAAYLLISEGRA